MRIFPIAGWNTKGVVAGFVLAVAGVLIAAPDRPNDDNANVVPKTFLILEASKIGEPLNGHQMQLLKFSPHYGKIDAQSLKLRLSKETQEMNLILLTEEGHEFSRGDLISFNSFRHMKLSPGSHTVRHLRDGGQELVP